MAGQVHEEDRRQHLLLGEGVVVLFRQDHAADHVVGRLAALAREEFSQVGGEVAQSLPHLLVHRLVAPAVDAEQVLGPAPDLLAILARDTEHVGDDRDREGVGELDRISSIRRLRAVSPRAAASRSARSRRASTIFWMLGRIASMPRPVKLGWTSLRMRVWSGGSIERRLLRQRPELLRSLRHLLPLLGGQPGAGIDGEAVVEQRGDDVVVVGDEEGLAVEERSRCAALSAASSASPAGELDDGDATPLAQRA